MPTVTKGQKSSIDKPQRQETEISHTGGEDNTKKRYGGDTTRSDPAIQQPASSAYANYAEDTGTL